MVVQRCKFASTIDVRDVYDEVGTRVSRNLEASSRCDGCVRRIVVFGMVEFVLGRRLADHGSDNVPRSSKCGSLMFKI